MAGADAGREGDDADGLVVSAEDMRAVRGWMTILSLVLAGALIGGALAHVAVRLAVYGWSIG